MATKQDRICAYFAAPLFNEMERGYNNHVTRQKSMSTFSCRSGMVVYLCST
jgi:hypothetical protein